MRQECVLFSIDDVSNIHTNAKFMRHVDTLRAMNKLSGSVVMCIGKWDDRLEQSFLCEKKDFDKHFKGFCANQFGWIVIPGDVKQPCTLWGPKGFKAAMKPMEKISAATAHALEAYTYNPTTNTYWKC